MNRKEEGDFNLTFSYVKRFEGASRVYALLEWLPNSTKRSEVEDLISEILKIRYASNTNSVFHFYFPIVSYVLFYQPEYEKDLLQLIVGPVFANGIDNVDEMIESFQGAMTFMQKENPNYLSKEAAYWTTTELPKLRNEIKREIDICWKELDED